MKNVSLKLSKLRLSLIESVGLLNEVIGDLNETVVPREFGTGPGPSPGLNDPGLVSKAEWHQKFVVLSERARDSKKSERLQLLRELAEMVASAIKVMTDPIGGGDD